MAFRLPTHLENLVPPPSEQMPQPTHWRGTLTVDRFNVAGSSSPTQIMGTAAETDGEW
jgi:hypothetical protein